MATSRKTQAKAGVAEKRRGQQMGDERSSQPPEVDEAQQQTPALRGRRGVASKFFADESFQTTGTSGESLRDNSPSVPAAIPTDTKAGESGGEAEFKARQKSARKGRK
jgi:hypothetical protein